MSKRPTAVLISDVHYNLNTLAKADKAMRMAIETANELSVPLIVAGDLTDNKANLRAECVNAIIETFSTADETPYVLVGNHDKIHEKSEDHALNFLEKYANLVENPVSLLDLKLQLMPYFSNRDDFHTLLGLYMKVGADFTIIMHQGVTGTNAGEYFNDPSAIPADWLAGNRVISGHYHTRQTIPLKKGGKLDYIGNPFTLGYGEAKDPEKGYQILYSDKSLKFVPTNLPRHLTAKVVLAEGVSAWGEASWEGEPRLGDTIKVTVVGPSDLLARTTKEDIRKLVEFDNIILDPQPTETSTAVEDKPVSQAEMFDNIIDSTTESTERKERLKLLWRTFA